MAKILSRLFLKGNGSLKPMCNHTVMVVGKQLGACHSDRVYTTEPKLEQCLLVGEKSPADLLPSLIWFP